MGTCKKCGKKTPFLNALCEDCEKEKKESELAEKRKRDEEALLQGEENKRHLAEDAKAIITSIVQYTTSEQPLKYLFINSDITGEKHASLPGMAAGVILGGNIGEMVFGGSVLNPKMSYKGKLGILVVTETQIIINYFHAAFYSFSGEISYDHLKLFSSQIASHKFIKKLVFDIHDSQIIDPEAPEVYYTIQNQADSFNFRQSKLFLNNILLHLPSDSETTRLIKDMGSVPTIDECISGLLSGKNPIKAIQFKKLENNEEYFYELSERIIKHKKRDLMVKNFTCLLTPVREKLIKKFSNKVNSSSTVLNFVVLMISVVIFLVSSIGMFYLKDNPLAFLSGFIAVVFFFVTIGIFVSSRRSLAKVRWCRTIISSDLYKS
jgi:hypothetical protein